MTAVTVEIRGAGLTDRHGKGGALVGLVHLGAGGVCGGRTGVRVSVDDGEFGSLGRETELRRLGHRCDSGSGNARFDGGRGVEDSRSFSVVVAGDLGVGGDDLCPIRDGVDLDAGELRR